MRKAVVFIFFTLLLVACAGEAPKKKDRPTLPYVVLSSVTDPATGMLSISIKVDPPHSEENLQTVAALVIENYKSQFNNITVKSYTRSDASGIPYGISTYTNNTISHQFNSQAAPQKIPSH